MNHFKDYSSGTLSPFRTLCRHHFHLVLRHFHHPKRRPQPHFLLVPPHSAFPSPWQPPVRFLPLQIYLLYIFHTNGIILYGTFWACFATPKYFCPWQTDPRWCTRAGNDEWGFLEPQGNSMKCKDILNYFHRAKAAFDTDITQWRLPREPHRKTWHC